jgi:hypothetical protein
LWTTDSWQELITLGADGTLFSTTAFSTDGTALGTMSTEGALHIWQAPSWAEINAAEATQGAGASR